MDTNNILEIFKKQVSETAKAKKYQQGLSIEDQETIIDTFEDVINDNLFDGQSIVSNLKGEIQ